MYAEPLSPVPLEPIDVSTLNDHTDGEGRSRCFAVRYADPNSRPRHTVPSVEPTLTSPVCIRRIASKYAANTATHSTSARTAIPAW